MSGSTDDIKPVSIVADSRESRSGIAKALAKIPGVGEVKLERYGDAVLETLTAA